MNDRRVYDVAATILECVVDALNDTTYGAPLRSYVNVAGDPAWDDCCDGQLTVTVTNRWRSSSFPDLETRMVQCQGGLVTLQIAVELVRCVPMQDDNGNPPSVEALQAAALRKEVEARAIFVGVACCLYEHRDVWSSLMGDQPDVGPDGGCAGSRLNLQVGVIV